jgi:hypothetical protein
MQTLLTKKPQETHSSQTKHAGSESSTSAGGGLQESPGLPLFLQPKLAISQPGDPYEQEADRVADQVMRMPELAVQRQCAACAAGGPMCSACEGEAISVSRKAQGAIGSDAPSLVHSVLRSTGQPLGASARALFEPRFGQDLGHVRVHTDREAQQSARDVSALAYTVGPHVVFDAGRYAPGTPDGQRLLAHELTHVLQEEKGDIGYLQRQASPTFSDGCEDWEEAMITSHLSDARRWIDVAEPLVTAYAKGRGTSAERAAVEAALRDNFHTTDPIHVARIAANIRALRTALHGALEFSCRDPGICANPEALAGAPFQLYLPGINDSWGSFGGDIGFCAPWFESPLYLVRVSTVLHEVGHAQVGLGAVQDIYEDRDASAYGALSPEEAIDNPDSYAAAIRQIYHGDYGPNDLVMPHETPPGTSP